VTESSRKWIVGQIIAPQIQLRLGGKIVQLRWTIVPVKVLFHSHNIFRVVSDPNDDGIVPVKALLDNYKPIRPVSLPNCVGMVPVKVLLNSASSCSDGNDDN
jgi:hypothetical protein